MKWLHKDPSRIYQSGFGERTEPLQVLRNKEFFIGIKVCSWKRRKRVTNNLDKLKQWKRSGRATHRGKPEGLWPSQPAGGALEKPAEPSQVAPWLPVNSGSCFHIWDLYTSFSLAQLSPYREKDLEKCSSSFTWCRVGNGQPHIQNFTFSSTKTFSIRHSWLFPSFQNTFFPWFPK